jgi:hypothetical protein
LSARLGAAEPNLDLSDLNWSRLLFVASEAASEVSAEVRLSPLPPGAAPREDMVEQTGAVPDGEVMLMTGKVRIKRFDKAFKTDVWFVPRDGSALKRQRHKSGTEPSQKTFWYLPQGVRRVRSDPQGRRERKLPAGQWTRVREHFYPYGPARAGCTTLTDPMVLLLLPRGEMTSEADQQNGLCAFNKKTLHHVTLRASAGHELEVDYRAFQGESYTRIKRRIGARKIVLKTRAPDGGALEPDPFEVFEMTGDIEIWVDGSSGLPVQIVGQVSGIGKVSFVLKEVTLRR